MEIMASVQSCTYIYAIARKREFEFFIRHVCAIAHLYSAIRIENKRSLRKPQKIHENENLIMYRRRCKKVEGKHI
jgi:hypothetical protein